MSINEETSSDQEIEKLAIRSIEECTTALVNSLSMMTIANQKPKTTTRSFTFANFVDIEYPAFKQKQNLVQAPVDGFNNDCRGENKRRNEDDEDDDFYDTNEDFTDVVVKRIKLTTFSNSN